jgi:hypothetical protein
MPVNGATVVPRDATQPLGLSSVHTPGKTVRNCQVQPGLVGGSAPTFPPEGDCDATGQVMPGLIDEARARITTYLNSGVAEACRITARSARHRLALQTTSCFVKSSCPGDFTILVDRLVPAPAVLCADQRAPCQTGESRCALLASPV